MSEFWFSRTRESSQNTAHALEFNGPNAYGQEEALFIVLELYLPTKARHVTTLMPSYKENHGRSESALASH